MARHYMCCVVFIFSRWSVSVASRDGGGGPQTHYGVQSTDFSSQTLESRGGKGERVLVAAQTAT